MWGRPLEKNQRLPVKVPQKAFFAAVLLIALWAGNSAGSGDRLPLILAAAVVGAAAFVFEPALALGAVFVAFTFGDSWLVRVPGAGTFTSAKLLVASSFAAWGLRSVVDKRDFLRVMPVTPAYVLVAGGMVAAMQASISPSTGFTQLSTLVLLLTMNHLLYTAVTPQRFVHLMNLITVCGVGGLFIGALAGIGEGRSVGLFRNSNEWASVCLLLGYVAIGWLKSWQHPLRGVALGATMILLPLDLMQAGSRAAILAFLVTLPMALMSLRRERWLFVWVLPLAAVTMTFFAVQAPFVQERFEAMINGDPKDGSIAIRSELLVYGLTLVREHPILGVGPGMAPIYNAVLYPLGKTHSFHNSFLRIAVEQGVVGVITHTILLWSLGLTVWRGIQGARTERMSGAATGIGIALVAFLVTTVANDRLMTYSMAHFVLGLALVVERMSREREPLPEALQDPGARAADEEGACASPS